MIKTMHKIMMHHQQHDCDFRSMHVYILTVNISINYDYYKKKKANISVIQGNTFCCVRLGGCGSC